MKNICLESSTIRLRNIDGLIILEILLIPWWFRRRFQCALQLYPWTTTIIRMQADDIGNFQAGLENRDYGIPNCKCKMPHSELLETNSRRASGT